MREERKKLFHAVRQFYFSILFPTLSCIALHSWWEASLCPSEGEAVSSTPSSGSSSSAWWLQWVSRFSILFPPFLCIPTPCLPCSLWPPHFFEQIPCLPKDETYHVVVWLWSGATIPIMLFIFAHLPHSKAQFLFQAVLLHVGKGNSCHFFSGCFFLPSLWSAVKVIFSSFFFLASSNRSGQQSFFSLATLHLAIIN